MSDEVFERLISELARLEYAGRFSYHFLNEPLLRRDLERLVARVDAVLPRATQVLFTNGDYLTQERYSGLHAAGIDLFVITSHDGTEFPVRPFQVVQFPDLLQLTNRGGFLRHLPTVTEDIRKKPCFAPSEMLIVTSSGDVVLCYEDAERKNVMGNVMAAPLDAIWNGPEFLAARTALTQGRRLDGPAICSDCTNLAHTEPLRSHASESFWDQLPDAWRRPARREAR